MNAFEMDRRIFQQYLYHRFLQNICQKRAADEIEFDEHFFPKRYEAIVVAAVMLGGHLQEHQK